MAAWFHIELYGAGGVVVKGDITEEVAHEMLRDEWRYDFHATDLDDREKVARMVSTQLAFAVERGQGGRGLFILDGPEGSGQKWFVPENLIAAFSITDTRMKRRPGFGPYEPADVRGDESADQSS